MKTYREIIDKFEITGDQKVTDVNVIFMLNWLSMEHEIQTEKRREQQRQSDSGTSLNEHYGWLYVFRNLDTTKVLEITL